MQLPPLTGNSPAAIQEYVEALVKSIEEELARRPSRNMRDGVVYLGGDMPVRMISPGGLVFDVSVDDAGALVITEVTL